MRRRLTWVCYGLGVAVAAAVLAFGLAAEWPVERTFRWVRGSGWAAIGTLALTLCVTPIGRLFERSARGPRPASVAAVRRALGIIAAALASAHLSLGIVTLLSGSLGRVLEVPWLRAGAAAALILVPLWVTSYPRMVKVLRVRLWKPLHRLTYVAGALALQHALLAPMSDERWWIALGAVVLALAPLRLLPRARPAAADAELEG